MADPLIPRTESAHRYSLLIIKLLETPLPDQQIVYRDISIEPFMSVSAFWPTRRGDCGERPLALVVLKAPETESFSEKSLLAYIKGYAEKGIVSKQVLLTKVRIVEGIDKTSVGKINKRALRQKYL